MKLFFLLPSLFFLSNDLAGQKFTISGNITDESSGEPLIGANIIDLNSNQGAVSNNYGFYSITLPAGEVKLQFSYVGYSTLEKEINLTGNKQFNISIPNAIELEAVEISAQKAERLEEKNQMSQIVTPIEQIKQLPALGGEVDVIKALQLLPGVQSGGEGQTGLYVRGGSPDQNLVLLDGVPVYNISHVLGIFSVFNADAIKNVTLTKGGFPARFGGRLSSILEINMKEGNLQEWHTEGALGLISSKITVEGPLQKGKTSILVSGRRTYADLIARPIIAIAQAGQSEKVDPRLHFYDLNAKIQHRINDQHRLYLSWYSGEDVFKFTFTDKQSNGDYNKGVGGLDWGNNIGALRWNYQIKPKLFANTTLIYSKYLIDITAGVEEKEQDSISSFFAKYFTGIEDFGAKVDFDFVPNPRHYIRFGANWTNHTYSPGALALKSSGVLAGQDTTLGSARTFANEYYAYAEDDINLGKLGINAGLHASIFQVNGKTYTSLQPRLSARYLLNPGLALKASYSEMTQYINLLTNESLSLPTDLWVPSTSRIPPQQSKQLAIGLAHTIQNKYEVSLEGFYKKMNNVLSYREGASFLNGLEGDWQDRVTQGSGEAYGLEFFLQKKTGKTTGWIGYTLSWNNRQFDEINGGRAFPFRYDRRHDLSLVVNHTIQRKNPDKKINLSAAWVFGTGNAVTLPTNEYPLFLRDNRWVYSDNSNGKLQLLTWTNPVNANVEKNAFRMSNYHRLDLSIEFWKKKKHGERAWVLGLYNAYSNQNPYTIIQSEQRMTRSDGSVFYKPVFKEISILPIVPSFSYRFKF